MDREITITLSDEEARIVEQGVASGAFGSESDVVRAALQLMESEKEAYEREKAEFIASIEEALADPVTYTTEEVWEHMLERHNARLSELASKGE